MVLFWISRRCFSAAWKNGKGIWMKIHLKPGKKEDKIVKVTEEEVEVSVKEKPEDGKANKAMIKLMRRFWNGDIRLIRGGKLRSIMKTNFSEKLAVRL